MSKINLIPEIKQQQIRARKINTLVTSTAIIIAIILGVVIFLLSAYVLARAQQMSSTEKNIKKVEQELEPYKELEENVLALETNLAEINNILAGGAKWTKFFTELEKVTPADIQVKTLDIKGSDVNMSLRGKEVKSIDRFIKSFSSYKVNDKNLFTDISVTGYSEDKGNVTFEAKLKMTAGILW